MRIHVHSPPRDLLDVITSAVWRDAVSDDDRHVVSFGTTPAEWQAAAPEAEALLCVTSGLRELLPIVAPRLRVIGFTSAGLERLAPFDWVPDGVTLLNNSGTHSAKAAEYVLMALLMFVNRMPALIVAQQERRWLSVSGTGLAGKRLTIVGLGAIGGAAAALAARFGMIVTGVRRRPAPHPDCMRVVGLDDLDSVLPDSDHVLVALPSTPDTDGLFDRRRLGLLPATAGIINVGRGAAIDEDALCDLLDDGRLGGAILDVFNEEPVPPDHRLWHTPNLVMTPHMSADDPATYNHNTVVIFRDNLAALEAGQSPPNRFDPAVGSRG